MRSTFARLFTYARDGKLAALENYTTEALAAAIRDQPSPIVRTLQVLALLPSGKEPLQVVPTTQVSVLGAGIIDLVLDVRYEHSTVEIWVEVKIMAGESGTQLDSYRRYISALPPDSRPRLVTLARAAIRDDVEIPWMPWQSVWRAAREATGSTHWRDLRLFLEEISMADRFDDPVSAREAASLEDVFGLIGKTRRLLAQFAVEANNRWPNFIWPVDERRVQRAIAGQFAKNGRLFVVAGDAYRAYLIVGVTPVEGEAHAAVWVETREKATDARRRVIAAADAAGLPPDWVRDLGPWGGLHCFERLVRLHSHDEVVRWFLARLEELDAAGILTLISTLGDAGPEETLEDDAALLS